MDGPVVEWKHTTKLGDIQDKDKLMSITKVQDWRTARSSHSGWQRMMYFALGLTWQTLIILAPASNRLSPVINSQQQCVNYRIECNHYTVKSTYTLCDCFCCRRYYSCGHLWPVMFEKATGHQMVAVCSQRCSVMHDQSPSPHPNNLITASLCPDTFHKWTAPMLPVEYYLLPNCRNAEDSLDVPWSHGRRQFLTTSSFTASHWLKQLHDQSGDFQLQVALCTASGVNYRNDDNDSYTWLVLTEIIQHSH